MESLTQYLIEADWDRSLCLVYERVCCLDSNLRENLERVLLRYYDLLTSPYPKTEKQSDFAGDVSMLNEASDQVLLRKVSRLIAEVKGNE